MKRKTAAPPAPRFRVRQGDVLVLGLTKQIPAGSHLTPIKPEGNRTVLAHGEVTGHAHALPTTAAQLYGPSDDLKRLLGLADSDRILHVSTKTQLTHEEHSAIAIPAGDYIVRRQREWTDADEPRQVAD